MVVGWLFHRKRKSQDRSHKLTIRKEQMAKLATIADAYDLDTDECIKRLIDGYFSAPHSPLGKDVTQVMATGARAQSTSNNPLMQIFSDLPPDVQQALVQKVIGTFLGQKEASSGFI